MARIEYAAPAHRGVTSLMAVGDEVAVGPPAIYFNVGRAAKFAVIGGSIGYLRSGRRKVVDYALGGVVVSLILNAFGK